MLKSMNPQPSGVAFATSPRRHASRMQTMLRTGVFCLLGVGNASAAPAVDAVPELTTHVTEEGQTVAFDRLSWESRELAKRLPLDITWPAEADVEKVFAQYVGPIPSDDSLIAVPSRIFGDVYLVNSFPNLTYLIDAGPEGLILIDPGLTVTVDAVRARITQLGLKGKKVRWLINTHAHFDHSMADAEFHMPGVDLMIGEDDAAAVEKGTEVTALSNFMPDTPFPKTKVDHRLSDGETLRLGNKQLHVIHTPGHTAGSSCFLLQVEGKNLLFSGDTLLYDNRLAFQGLSYANPRQYLESLKKLADFRLKVADVLRWDVLLPGHGAIVMNRAYVDVEKGLRTAQIDAVEGDSIEALPFGTPRYRMMMFGRP